jgi:hypothetical protein
MSFSANQSRRSSTSNNSVTSPPSLSPSAALARLVASGSSSPSTRSPGHSPLVMGTPVSNNAKQSSLPTLQLSAADIAKANAASGIGNVGEPPKSRRSSTGSGRSVSGSNASPTSSSVASSPQGSFSKIPSREPSPRKLPASVTATTATKRPAHLNQMDHPVDLTPGLRTGEAPSPPSRPPSPNQ